MLCTGLAGKLKLAHLLPVSTSPKIRQILRIPWDDDDGIWSLRNVLLLAEGVEHAYDRLQLSFTENPLHIGVYHMRIWDESIRNTPIWPKEGRTDVDVPTIGSFENMPLNLTFPNDRRLEPFKRALCYQELMCYIRLSALPSSQCLRDFIKFRKDMVGVMCSSLVKTILEECEGSDWGAQSSVSSASTIRDGGAEEIAEEAVLADGEVSGEVEGQDLLI